MAGDGRWGRPPAAATLLWLARQLEQDLREGEPAVLVLRAAARIAVDLGQQAQAQQARQARQAQQAQQAQQSGRDAPIAHWPPLSGELAAALLRLLHLSGTQAAAEEEALQPGSSSNSSSGAAVLEGGQALLLGLAAAQQPLSSALCEELLQAFWQQPALRQWAGEAFGEATVQQVEQRAVEEGGPPLLLHLRGTSATQRQQQQEQQAVGAAAAVDSSTEGGSETLSAARAALRERIRGLSLKEVRAEPQRFAWAEHGWRWLHGVLGGSRGATAATPHACRGTGCSNSSKHVPPALAPHHHPTPPRR